MKGEKKSLLAIHPWCFPAKGQRHRDSLQHPYGPTQDEQFGKQMDRWKNHYMHI